MPPKLDAVEMERRLRAELRADLREELEAQLQPLASRLSILEALFGEEDCALLSQKERAKVSKLPVPVAKPMVSEYTGDTSEDLLTTHACFEGTTWNVLLVLGLTDTGWVDDCIACLVLAVNIVMQLLFCKTILSPQFAGGSFSDKTSAAKRWRELVGHDASYMDPTPSSLVSRVCNNDETLIMAQAQASLIKNINAYLGLGNMQMHAGFFAPGILLCTLCIMQWCLYLFEEFRTIFLATLAIWQVPRASRTVLRLGRLASICQARFVGHLALTCLRACIAAMLLHAGILWLAGTTSIAELMVNGVALVAILDVDEKLFASLMPRRIQAKVDELHAVKLRWSKTQGQVESLVLVVCIAGVLLWSCLCLLVPLEQAMQAVKQEYCGGARDFVLKVNPNVKVPVTLVTAPYSEQRPSLSEVATRDVMRAMNRHQTPTLAVVTQSLGDFTTWSTRSLNKWSSGYMQKCLSWDYPVFINSAAFAAGRSPKGVTCENLAGHCQDPSAQLLRVVCPFTCGCTDPTLAWYRSPSSGCPAACLRDSEKATARMPCRDLEVRSRRWRQTWQRWPEVAVFTFQLDKVTGQGRHHWKLLKDQAERLLAGGCPLLATEKVHIYFNSSFCQGARGLFSSLAPLCPETCGCRTSRAGHGDGPQDCPLSCA
ncbi:unnamed protein product [Effrenium voratum]|uniref:Uncharacterized protein n=1 Tax=Effrenium voratum TaxID=2562239 RepID=A0AA36I8M7_9DINO|nr:unnamed protein product [Effrenium voratum]